MKIEVNNWWILGFFSFVLITSALDSVFIKAVNCPLPINKFILYLGRNFFELTCGVMGVAIGYLLAIRKKRRNRK